MFVLWRTCFCIKKTWSFVLDRLTSIIDQEERWDKYMEQIQFVIIRQTEVLDLRRMNYS